MQNIQLKLWEDPVEVIEPANDFDIDPFSYDHIIVAFSGKDSLACLLELFELGVPKEKIEIWHHIIDGREGSTLMDWPCTSDYCRAVAEAFDIPVYFSWKIGGFESELLRENSLTAPTTFETPDGLVTSGGIRGSLSTRRKFPQVSADLSVRWCSAYLKIDVCSKAISGQDRFNGKRVLLVTGERAEESPSRSRYKQAEEHKTNGKKRTVHQWRPVHQWEESRVWAIIEKYRVNPHWAYQLGWGRVSCAACIFGSKDQWKSLSEIMPEKVQTIANYEEEFGVTINRTKSVPELVALGQAYPDMRPEIVAAALSETYTAKIILEPGEWKLPAGAYGEGCGPT